MLGGEETGAGLEVRIEAKTGLVRRLPLCEVKNVACHMSTEKKMHNVRVVS